MRSRQHILIGVFVLLAAAVALAFLRGDDNDSLERVHANGFLRIGYAIEARTPCSRSTAG